MYSYAAPLVTWLLFTVFANALVENSEAGCYDCDTDSGSHLSLVHDRTGWPDAADGDVEHCIGGSDWSNYKKAPPHKFYPYSAHTLFRLPVDSEMLYLITRGGTNIGTVTLVSSDTVRSTVNVRVHVGYHKRRALNRANVCLLSKEHDTQGIGIYTPARWFPSKEEGRMHFDVTVVFPATHDGSPLWIENFQSTLSHYSFKIKDIEDSVYFHSINVQANDAGINSDSIFAFHATFRSTQAFIRGAFKATHLVLTTTKGPIEAQVDHPSKGPYLTGVSLETNEDSMQSTLYDNANGGGPFSVEARTFDGPITISYTNTPTNSIQQLVAVTRGSPVKVTMSSAYEGAFSLQNTRNNPIRVIESDAEDPSGRGRERVLRKYSRDRNHMKGTVYWSPRGPGWRESKILIETDRAPIRLTI
ncbi:hypothetical protein SERLADRAFT_417653 [Serpula lacrymans var. lacrymans S7.9]|uniref:Uncharacterized protein n=1 Tax=Serpula lacrymans var. lacrymans (strain S7.9) TaxID=578457 RepID=F8P7D1_SERL9|nr:uncharacterized protein SERLADRAFT_417653 [Serpula lacrymans var. lacrymans S7.9]EGO21347.1 hypothetical protein SERLADRAFT_417653 [Serpula lacrymans var. lacrymans S7.9]